jgi:hypothetical protein
MVNFFLRAYPYLPQGEKPTPLVIRTSPDKDWFHVHRLFKLVYLGQAVGAPVWQRDLSIF